MLRVAAYTSGRNVSSARFRVRQYIPGLRDLGVEVRERWARLDNFPPKNKALRPLWAIAALCERALSATGSLLSDITLLQREMLSTMVTAEPLTKGPRALDVDDAIWLPRSGSSARRLAQLCDFVICGNAFLGENFRRWNPRIHILPTAVDTDRYRPPDSVPISACRLIGWCGSASTLRYLAPLAPAFKVILERYKDVKLRVVADKRPSLAGIPDGRLDFIPWSAEGEVGAIQEMSIGLMPLEDSLWTRGKCSFKLLTYMACGVPAVASPVGMNVEVLAAGGGLAARGCDEWVDAIDLLLNSESTARRVRRQGRDAVEREYSLRTLTPRLAQILRSCS